MLEVDRTIAWHAQDWEPTMELRWLEGVGLETGAYCLERVLQQKWIERKSGTEGWRLVPLVGEHGHVRS